MGSDRGDSQRRIVVHKTVMHDSEIILINQINYCRFMAELYKILHSGFPEPSAYSKIEGELAAKIN